jgi:hypothetical protein
VRKRESGTKALVSRRREPWREHISIQQIVVGTPYTLENSRIHDLFEKNMPCMKGNFVSWKRTNDDNLKFSKENTASTSISGHTRQRR